MVDSNGRRAKKLICPVAVVVLRTAGMSAVKALPVMRTDIPEGIPKP